MATSFKNPPLFDPRSMNYETWKNKVSVWQLVTELKKEKQALAVSLTLTGNAREVAMDIPAADLTKDDGMDKLITQLDKVFYEMIRTKHTRMTKMLIRLLNQKMCQCQNILLNLTKDITKQKT